MQAFENVFWEEGVYFLCGRGSIIFEILLATQEKIFFVGGMLKGKFTRKKVFDFKAEIKRTLKMMKIKKKIKSKTQLVREL